MHTLHSRERAYENKFAHDRETAFRVNARRNRLFGQWAAGQLGLVNGEAERYAEGTVMEDFAGHGQHDSVIGKIHGDLANKGLQLSIQELHGEYEKLLSVAATELGAN